MVVQGSKKQLVRFGVFEFDSESGELRKRGIKLSLQRKPMQLLQVLLERPGEIITREDLRRRLWGDETFVDFESGLNTAANRLRLKLGDSAENPRYIETLARTGDRFIAPVVKVNWDLPQAESPESQPIEPPRRRTLAAALLIAPAIMAVLVLAWLAFRPAQAPRAHFRQLTFRAGQVLGARFAPDGHEVLYAAQWDRDSRQVFLTSAVAPE